VEEDGSSGLTTRPARAGHSFGDDMKVTTYKGVDIELSGEGFSATVNGKRVKKPSVAAVKAAIDKVSEFKKFKALHWTADDNGKIRITNAIITGIKERKSRYFGSGKFSFTEAKQGYEPNDIALDTASNRAVLAAYEKELAPLRKQIKALERKVDAVEKKHEAKIVNVSATSLAAKLTTLPKEVLVE